MMCNHQLCHCWCRGMRDELSYPCDPYLVHSLVHTTLVYSLIEHAFILHPPCRA